MTTKSALYALAVVVLTGSMAVAAFAEAPVMEGYDSGESSYSGDVGMSEANPGSVEAQLEAEGIREPVETGAVPDQSIGSSELGSGKGGDEPTVEFGGLSFRPDIDLGP